MKNSGKTNFGISLWIAGKAFLILTLLTGLVYPVAVSALAQLFFDDQANGSLIRVDNRIIGSRLIGQQFDNPRYFQSRPSEISYNPWPSGGSNDAITSRLLQEKVKERKTLFLTLNHLDSLTPVPSEMIFSSGSGLDPHISRISAQLQANRVAFERNYDQNQLRILLLGIDSLTEKAPFFIPGQERINVLSLNLLVDQIR
jgi:K+-transporting ATPase ATPase C chain